jgi:hypothetical protein
MEKYPQKTKNSQNPLIDTTTKFINRDLSKWPSEAGNTSNRLG